MDLFTPAPPIDPWHDEAIALIAEANKLAFPETAIANRLRQTQHDAWAYGVRCAIAWAKRVSPEAAQAIQDNLDAETRPTEYGDAA